MTEPISDRLALVFLERFWSDRDAGRSFGLLEYLDQFAGHDEVVAREYLSALAEARGEKAGENQPSEEGRIGPYRLLEELGRGGQGVVWLAEDTRLGRRVALKVLTGLGPGAETHVARFRREAALASKLDHPGICGVHDTGIEGGVPYIAMRYVEGETLADRLSRSRSAGVESAASGVIVFDEGDVKAPSETLSKNGASLDRGGLDLVVVAFEKVARALHAAHEVGIVHRDLKPGNIMITADGEPVLLDFGLAQDDSGGAGPTLTQTGDVFGTPAYMSPEQITGRRVKIDRRSDVYSLGVTLYECLTTKRPFEAPTRESLYQAILSKEPERARKHNRRIPSDLEVVLQCAMSKDRDKRYQTAADLAEDLRRVHANEPILAKKVSMLGRAWRWSKRRPAAAALVCALAIAVPTISGLGVWYWTHRDDVKAQERARRDELLEDALEVGFYELHEGSVDEAVVAFEKALSFDAGSPEAVVGLAMGRAKRESPEALQAALGVIHDGERTVADPKVLARTKADILARLGRKAEAAVAMDAAPKIEGPLMCFLEGTREIDAGHGIGEKNSRAQRSFQDAASHLARAVSGSVRARRAYHFQLAHAIGHCKPARRDSALAMADAIEALWPTSPKAWRWIGFVCVDVDPGREGAAYREAIRLEPKDPFTRTKLGKALRNQGKLEEAIAECREAIRLDPKDAIARLELGLAVAAQGKKDEAIAEYREAIRLNPKDAFTHMKLGVALGDQGKQAEAMAQHREAIRLAPTDALAQNSFAIALAAQGEQEQAIAEFRKAIRLDPKYALARTNLGRALAIQGKLEEAIVELREAIRLDPVDSVAHTCLGSALVDGGKIAEGIAEYREVIRLDPKQAAAHLSLGVALMGQGQLEEAIAECREGIRLEPDDGSARYTLGRALQSVENHDEAAVQLREAVRLDPKETDARVALGISLSRQGKPEEAIAEHHEAIRLDPKSARAHSSLGILLAMQDKVDAAIAEFREAIKLDPADAIAPEGLGRLLMGQGKLDDAIAALRARIRIKPDDAGAHCMLAAALHQHGDPAEAVAVQRNLLQLMKGADLADLKLVEMQDALDLYRDAIGTAESKPSQAESRK